jgi:hypothetical protein
MLVVAKVTKEYPNRYKIAFRIDISSSCRMNALIKTVIYNGAKNIYKKLINIRYTHFDNGTLSLIKQ